ncbi:hypothetical protein COU61_05020 [Candidatus Pacearchaeota archaeon CG10_big_fil_rev_8_21_14_0_10_35_13]|nr:MAG: hypothetical protein COU61_05020 [Candidatus Pacearchaeota archaeon CG10_big_fil_rev_8_21_14_0_10_35_13]
MDEGIIRQAFKLGNSAGVLLPVGWNGRKVIIKLLKKPINQEVIEILEERDLLKNTLGIYLTGSYSRNEETESSDVDILVITDKINLQIKKDKYEIVLVSKEKFEKKFQKDLYLYSMIREARAIMNNELLEKYKNKNSKIQINKIITEIKAVTKINEKAVSLDEELGIKVSDGTVYSIILRLRELYLIKCLKEKKSPTNKEFLKIIKSSGSEGSYESYLRIKNDKKPRKVVSVIEANLLINELKNMIEEIKNG